jgi:hypothetical protein
MKSIVLILLMSLFGFTFIPGISLAQEEKSADLTVYYFHNTRRCATCNAIEAKTIETLDTYFKDQMESGAIQMVTLNAEKEENKEICEKYEIWGSTLMLVKTRGEKEDVENVTDFAFANARTNPEKFISGLKTDIEKLLD